jgi:hypothetical protein
VKFTAFAYLGARAGATSAQMTVAFENSAGQQLGTSTVGRSPKTLRKHFREELDLGRMEADIASLCQIAPHKRSNTEPSRSNVRGFTPLFWRDC